MHKIGWMFFGLLFLGSGVGVSVAVGSSWAFAIGVLGVIALAATVAQIEQADAIRDIVSDRKPTNPLTSTDEPAG